MLGTGVGEGVGVGAGVGVGVGVGVAIITGLDRGCTTVAWAETNPAADKLAANKTRRKPAKADEPVLFMDSSGCILALKASCPGLLTKLSQETLTKTLLTKNSASSIWR